MKEEAPIGNPFIGEPKGGWPAKDAGQAASLCGHCPSTLSKRCGDRAKGVDSGGRRWPTNHQSLTDRPCLTSTQFLLSSSTSSCSYHAHSTDQKHQK
jgi:hypothetical protein